MQKKQLTTQQEADMSTICEGLETTSSKIRALYAAGHDKADIARFLGIIYQHVRNVLVTKTKKHKPE